MKEKMTIKDRISKFIVHNRYVFLGIFVLLLVGSCILIPKVELNYDLTKYLEKDSISKQDLTKMTEEFGEYGNANVMLKGVTEEQASEIADEILKLDCVTASVFDKDSSYKDGKALISIFLNVSSFDPKVENCINDIRGILNESGYEYEMNGSAITMVFYQEHMIKDMLIILALAIVVITGVLLISSNAYIEPLIVLIILGVAILLNMGTNYFMGQICFVTNAICAVLQLALSMDYSIVLLHRYEYEKTLTPDSKIAMRNALSSTYVAILSSSLTTVAGLISLVFMKFSIGYDIGMVLAKSIVISLLTVFFLMPSLIILFNKPIQKTVHKPIRFKYKGLLQFERKTQIVVPVILLIAIICGAVFNYLSTYSYSLKASSRDNSQINLEDADIQSTYGQNTPFIIMIPDIDGEIDYDLQEELIEGIMNIETSDGRKIITSAQSLSQYKDMEISKGQLRDEYGLNNLEIKVLWNAGHFNSDVVTLGQLIDLLKEEKKNKDSIIYSQFEQTSISKLLNMLDNDKYSRIVFTMDCGVAEEQAFEVSHKVREYLQTNYSDKEIYFVGESIVYYDIRETYNNDAKIINIISLFSILALVLIAFKSISIPVLLVLIVQGAIWINFSINTIANDQLFFITYLVVMCIQMGATIDYGILMTSQYIDNRKTMDKYDALQRTLYTSLPTIFSSGSILIIAPLLVGALSNIAIISEIGFLLCRGCLVSVFLIVLALPQILLLCDKLIEKTSLKTSFYKEVELVEDVELEEEIKEHKESLQDV